MELSAIQRMLPNELLQHVLSFLPAAALGAAQCVCRQWRDVGAAPPLWRAACRAAFRDTDDGAAAVVAKRHGGCWKRMLLERPHIRTDGIYGAWTRKE